MHGEYGEFSAIFDPRIFLERTFGGIVSGQYEYYITLPGAHEEKERISHMYNGKTMVIAGRFSFLLMHSR